MAEHKLALKKRELTGKKLKSLRKEGFIPSVVYGNKEPKLFSSEYVATEKVLEKAGYHSPIDLDLEGKKQMAIVKDIQIDPVSRMIVNVEFQAISAREVVEAMTPITIVNFEESEASKTYHFMMTQAIEEIAIKAKPADLPNGLEIDASGLENVEDKLTIKDIKLPEGVEFSDKELDLEQVVVSLYDPVAEAEKREAEAEAEAEVEGSETAEEEAETKNAEAETSGETEEKTEEASEE
ncbi:50S ribosomal protein L25 [Candidatus Saccharibacteria bacterium]|nr:50S ribosomal protein L25 [Candidatus Saccharibacteria bacterium]